MLPEPLKCQASKPIVSGSQVLPGPSEAHWQPCATHCQWHSAESESDSLELALWLQPE